MNAEAELTKALVANVGEIAVAAHRLHAVLKDENQVLASGDDTALLALTGAKTELLQQIEALEGERMHLVGELRTGPRHAPFAMVRALTPYPAALTAWDDAVATLKACRALNEANGTTVELRLRQVRQALALLTGASPAAGLYGPQGAPESLRRSTVIARI
ncbi:MAG: flagellar protein FlgN [Rhodanobacteraceae bacterium]